MKRQWTPQEAWEWYDSQPWIRGFNGYPSNCVNRIAMWQEYKHDEVVKQLHYEFDLARKTGFNAVRTIIQFEVWLYEHDSFMKNFEEYLTLADQYGLKVMLTLGNDCCVPRSLYRFGPENFGEQNVDWGYHSGLARGQHSGLHNEPCFILPDDEEFTPKFYAMVDELAAKYAKDPRIHIWDVWNEIGNSNRGNKSVAYMEELFRIIRSHDPIQPLTADCFTFNPETQKTEREAELRALELSDVITFHFYRNFQDMIRVIEWLKEDYGRPIINNEWLNRIEHNNVDEIYPLFYLEKIGSYHWGLIAGYSQCYEPWGSYLKLVEDPDYNGPFDLTKWQHDLYRFNGMPYIAKEIEIIKKFNALADEKFAAKQAK